MHLLLKAVHIMPHKYLIVQYMYQASDNVSNNCTNKKRSKQ